MDKKRAMHSQHPAVWTECNAVVADNVAQAADATIRSLQRSVFAGMLALDLASYCWALPRISSYFIFTIVISEGDFYLIFYTEHISML